MAIEYDPSENPTTGIPFSNGQEEAGLINKKSEGGAYTNESVGEYATAVSAANNAKQSELNAAESETNAATSATNAASSATASASSATASADSASSSATSADNAATSETNAATSATNAANSATNASTSETNAATSESNAATSALNAATSETNASTSESNAATSEANAAISETNAANSASASASSATASATSASHAATSESNASTSEDNALASATAAANSASAAAASEANAQASAAAALASEQAAQSSEDDAETAQVAAESAQASAEAAETAAETAQVAAETAQTASESAQTAAESAQASATASANSATASATSAASSAQDAQSSEDDAETSATAAAASASAASSSASAASTSATASATSATQSATSASNAATSASNAATSETNAATSATNAFASETAAATSEDNASNSATASANSATASASSAAAALASETAAATSETNAAASELAAATSESNAATSESNAATSETNAATSETNAATSETNASNSAAAALASETAAATSEANASTSETNAAASESAAATSESNASASATSAANSASAASLSASAASESETNAAASELAAATSETNAATSETNASNSATAASLSATSASTSATSASDSESAAAASELAAATSETNAASSATNAASSATAAATSATSASDSASAAATSETNAETAETNAASSATAAATSATNAANSATASATSASNAATSETNAEAVKTTLYGIYLGLATEDPTVDLNGQALSGGEFYYNTTTNITRIYNGSAWVNGAVDTASFVLTDSDATLDSLQLNGGTGDQGTLSWNTDEETIDVIQGDAVLQMGQEIHYNVRNNTGSTIYNGTPVMVTGTLGASGRLTVAPMDGTDIAYSKYFIGLTTQDITDGSDGKVTAFGKVRHIDTESLGYTEGSVLWISTTNIGELTNVEPTSGMKLPIAFCIHEANNGTIFVRAAGSSSSSLHESNDVILEGTIADNEVLAYDSTSGVWKNQTVGEAGLATSAQGTKADTAHSWGDHGAAGYFSASGGTITGATVVDGSLETTDGLIVGGNLTVNGTTTTVNAENLAVADNMIYLNDGNTTANVDLGWAGNYNDGTYAHAGFFRDATDGRFKVYEGYTLEPDAAPDIDTSHASFTLATIQAATFYGNLSGNASSADTADKWDTPRTITLGGDLSGNVSIDGTSDVTLNATINSNSVALGTDTTGNYAGGVAAGDGIVVTGVAGEGTTFTVAHADTSSQASVNNSGNTFIQDVTLDEFGHITGLASVTVDIPAGYDGWNISDGTNSENVTDGSTINIVGSGATSTSYNATTNTLTISSTDNNTVYSHPTYTGDDFSVDTGPLTGATVVSDIDINVTTDTLGHVTDANGVVSTRTLTLGDLGYTGATDANKYVHPTHPGDDINLDTGPLTGATVISDLDFNVTTDTLGHVTDANATYSTRNLTYSDVGAAPASHDHNRLISIDDRDVKPNATGLAGIKGIKSFFTSLGGMTGTANTDYQDLLVLDTYSDSSGGNPNAITMDKSDGAMRIWNGAYNGTTWNTGQRVFADNYHPNADKWTTARTLTLNGDVSGSVSIDGSANKTLTVTVADDSHNHTIANVDGLQAALDGKQAAGTYNTIIGTDSDINTSGSTIIDNIYVTDGVITSMGTRTLTASDIGAAASSHTHSYLPLSGGTMTGNIMMNDEYIDFKTSGNPALPQIRGFRGTTDLNTRLLESEGGFAWTTYDSSTANKPSGTTNNANGVLSLNTHGGAYGHQLAFNNSGGFWHRSEEAGSIRSWDRVFTDSYHPNADKWTTARTLSLSGDASGSVSWDGSANATLSVTVNDDSHSHSNYLPLSGGTLSDQLTIDTGEANPLILQRTSQLGIEFKDTSVGSRYLGVNSGNLLFGSNLNHGTNNKVFHDSYHPNADKWTTARTNTVTLTGDVTGSGSASVDGTGNWTVSLSTAVGNDSHNHDHSDGGFTVNGNLLVGGSNTENYIAFRGTNGDSPGGFNHGYIGEHIYSGSEISELLLFKGNDIPGSGPDRIRHFAAEHAFDTYTSATSGTFDAVSSSANAIRRMTISNSGAVSINQGLSVGTSVKIGSEVVLQESTDRADLLQITSTTSGWAGLQIRNSSNEGRWSFMTDGTTGGFYDDENGDWAIQMLENSEVRLYHNGSEKLNTHGSGITVTGTLTETSDRRLKKDIETLDNALDRVGKLNGYTFTMIDNEERQTGVIAQEVQEVLPEAVRENDEGTLSVSYGNMVGLLIEAIKEQQTQIDELKAQVEALNK